MWPGGHLWGTRGWSNWTATYGSSAPTHSLALCTPSFQESPIRAASVSLPLVHREGLLPPSLHQTLLPTTYSSPPIGRFRPCTQPCRTLVFPSLPPALAVGLPWAPPWGSTQPVVPRADRRAEHAAHKPRARVSPCQGQLPQSPQSILGTKDPGSMGGGFSRVGGLASPAYHLPF